MDVGVWLRSLGLEKYEAAFRENEINETVLRNLTADDLKDLGVAIVGHRRKLLDAMAALRDETSKTPTPRVSASTDIGAPGLTVGRGGSRGVMTENVDLICLNPVWLIRVRGQRETSMRESPGQIQSDILALRAVIGDGGDRRL